MEKETSITYDRLKELLEYDPATGKFFWRVARGPRAAGTEAGTVDSEGYVRIKIDRRMYKAHRLAWLYVHGYTPENDLDHIDRDPSNNRVENLREVSQVCNQRNCGNPKNNKSSVKGVHWTERRGKWRAQIVVNQRNFNLGYYDDFTEAVCARLAAEQCIGWEGCDSSSPAYQYLFQGV